MNQSEIIIDIDKVLGVKINPDKYNNEFNALSQLKAWMILLYNNTKPMELSIVKNNQWKNIFYFGTPWNDDFIPQDISTHLPNYFHWFWNSIINYARLTGFIVGRENGNITDEDLQLEPERKKIKQFCDNYVKSIPELVEILKWRNKVSAHFALTDPRNEDNIATMQSSITFPICFEKNRFRTAGSFIFSISDSNNTYESEIPDWSITETFEKLTNRFWTDIIFNE